MTWGPAPIHNILGFFSRLVSIYMVYVYFSSTSVPLVARYCFVFGLRTSRSSAKLTFYLMLRIRGN
ncbi:hypothetical protein BDV24DRAFT_125966 [Aspergillus arachidicola]|uniref:Uncharacterized protein n=1 Tax=Aspergillus arachidicola TaxID=656916 RepID=A0A5N6YPE7_9EURO|nr:hypothetical protein BDV24DRAFT_125966 [Aspergillus arachidicola]